MRSERWRVVRWPQSRQKRHAAAHEVLLRSARGSERAAKAAAAAPPARPAARTASTSASAKLAPRCREPFAAPWRCARPECGEISKKSPCPASSLPPFPTWASATALASAAAAQAQASRSVGPTGSVTSRGFGVSRGFDGAGGREIAGTEPMVKASAAASPLTRAEVARRLACTRGHRASSQEPGGANRYVMITACRWPRR